jgi:signal transduction histidine kinase/ligand-binding sensor domain-containing protein/AraC-like DNA-binding protein/AmiR/NasT family two-component response regulator
MSDKYSDRPSNPFKATSTRMSFAKRYKFLLFILITICYAHFELKAQNPGIICTHYNVNNGLITNMVEYVYVDREGYVWFATATGLQQFDGFNFVNYLYNSDDSSSISYNFISTLSEDRNGNIWIGTLGKGLNIFNKERGIFYHLKNESDDGSFLTSNIIPRGRKVIIQDSEGYLWVNTNFGLNKINIETRLIEHFHGDLTGDIIYDQELKVLWIASDRIKKFDTKTKKIEHFYVNKEVMPNMTNISSIVLDKDGLIWLGSDAGIVLFDKKSNQFYNLPGYLKVSGVKSTDMYSWSFRPINAIYEDNKGFIWIAIDKSLYKINKLDGKYSIYTHEIDNPNSILDEKIIGIYGNKTGVLWITYMGKGVSKVNISLKDFIPYKQIPGDPNGLSGNVVRSVYKDNYENLWIGMYNDGLNRIMPREQNKIIHYKFDPLNKRTINSNYITAIYVDGAKRLWVGTFNKGFCYADNIYSSADLEFTRLHFEDNLEVQDFKEDAAGRIWIGSQNGLYVYNSHDNNLIHYGDIANQLPEMQGINIQSFLYEEPNIFRIASWNRGFCKLYVNSDTLLTHENKRDSLIIYDKITDIHHSNIDNCFTTIIKDEKNIFWLGSNVNGLIKMVEEDSLIEFFKYDKSMGAPDNSVYGIASDRDGNIWISTNHGLGKFSTKTEQFKSYYESDGILSNSFLWDASCKSEDGEIFFGGINGLIAFYPDRIHDDTTTYPVFISKLIVQNKEVRVGDEIHGRKILTKNIQYTDKITLTHLETAFSLEFVSLNNLNPDETQYAYKLEGFNPDWIYTSYDRRYITYTNLRQGTYHFMVKASNSDGVWNEKPASLVIRVLPPWWRTFYALVIFSVLFIMLLYMFRRLILMRARLIHEARLELLKREKTEELYNVKMQFFTDISHEFRTPLSLILAPLQKIITLFENDPGLTRQIQLIRKNADRLLRLIDQIIDLRKIDLNKMKLDLSRGDIVRYVKELTDSFDDIALQRSMTLEFSSAINSYETWFDESKLEKIMYNLLSNAFKFTPDGGKIRVSLTLRQKENIDLMTHRGEHQDTEYVEITIRDNGIGIPTEHRRHLFERFYRIERHDSIIRRGTGIGLALTKELVDLHKGEIMVESEENKGTCFVILLPSGKDHWSDDQMIETGFENKRVPDSFQPFVLTEEHEYAQKYSGQKIKMYHDKKNPIILLVEDEADVRTFIREYFEINYQIIEASNGIEGLDMAIRNNPEIIISDVIMPLMDGVEMCQKLKEDIRTSHIPIIMLTARSSLESKIEGLETGADVYIEKPFSIDLLEVQINNLLENRKKLRDKFSKELVLQPADIAITSVDAVFIQKAMAIVDKHISDPDFGSEEFCREIGMSRSQLHRKLKALTSQPASEFIRTMRLKRAANLLKDSQLSVEEISFRVGFNSPAYFTKCFKLLFGKTPSDFAG